MRSIRIKRHMPYAPELVWTVLTESRQMEQWLMPNDFKAEVGHRFQFKTKPGPGFDGIVDCEVLKVDPQRSFSMSWKGGGIDTTVTFTLAPHETGTEILLVQEGFKLTNFLPWMILGRGWKSILGKKIPKVLSEMTAEIPL